MIRLMTIKSGGSSSRLGYKEKEQSQRDTFLFAPFLAKDE
jgi:hypothetical protein